MAFSGFLKISQVRSVWRWVSRISTKTLGYPGSRIEKGTVGYGFALPKEPLSFRIVFPSNLVCIIRVLHTDTHTHVHICKCMHICVYVCMTLYVCMYSGVSLMWPESQTFFLFCFFFNVYLFWGQRETEHERGRGREREGDTESETGSRL